MKYIIVVLMAVALMSPAAMAGKKNGGGAAVQKPEKVAKAAAEPSFKGTLAVAKGGEIVTNATLTVKDVVYQIKLDDNGMKLAGDAADKEVVVHGSVVTTPGADGKEIKTITVDKYTIVPAKAADEGKKKGKH